MLFQALGKNIENKTGPKNPFLHYFYWIILTIISTMIVDTIRTIHVLLNIFNDLYLRVLINLIIYIKANEATKRFIFISN